MIVSVALIDCSTLSCDPSVAVTTTPNDATATKTVIGGKELWIQSLGVACKF